jgi:hypothetical protein
MRQALHTLTLLIAATACGEVANETSFGSARQAIVNGQASDGGDDATVMIESHVTASEAIACTGTVIAPNLVATALHCVTQSYLGEFSCKPDGSLSDSTRADGKIGPLVAASGVEIFVGVHPTREPSARGASLLGTGSTQICRGDIAFVVLDRPLDMPIAPVRLSAGVDGGDLLRVVGYGQTEANGSSGRFARTGVRVIDVGPSSEDQVSISASPRTFVVNEGPCHGDSGGPAFTEESGALVGVYSLTAGASCTGAGIRNVYTSLSSFSSLALQAFEAAGAEPVLDDVEPEAEPPALVAENGCSFAASSLPRGSVASLGSIALAALGIALGLRRHRV